MELSMRRALPLYEMLYGVVLKLGDIYLHYYFCGCCYKQRHHYDRHKGDKNEGGEKKLRLVEAGPVQSLSFFLLQLTV
jgi:hypothetical protein